MDSCAPMSPALSRPPAKAAPDPEPATLVELRGVTRRAGRATILNQVSLSVGPGEFVAILGPNGAGKSTLLSLVNATLCPTQGTVRLLGVDPWSVSERQRSALRARVGVVPQRSDFNALIPLSAREVVAIGRLRGRAFSSRLGREDRRLIDETLERLGIGALAGRVYRTLSGGEQQKVQLARVLVQQPALLLLDEPAAGLDLYWQEQLTTLIGELSRELRLPIVMTTHILGHLPACCRRAALMRGGRILFDGPAEDTLSAERIGEAFGFPVQIVEHGGRRHCLGAGEAPR